LEHGLILLVGWKSERTAIKPILQYSTNGSVFIMERDCVYYVIRNDTKNAIQIFIFKSSKISKPKKKKTALYSYVQKFFATESSLFVLVSKHGKDAGRETQQSERCQWCAQEIIYVQNSERRDVNIQVSLSYPM